MHGDDVRYGDVAARAARDPPHRAAGRFGERAQVLRRRDNLLEFDRIGRADIDQGLALAVADAIEAEFVDLDRRARETWFGRLELRLERLAGRTGHGHFRHVAFQALALDGQRLAARAGSDRLFFELRLLHQPMSQPAQKVEIRPAAFEAARPQPELVGEQQRDAALVDAREDQQRPIVDAVENVDAPGRLGPDLPEPGAPEIGRA